MKRGRKPINPDNNNRARFKQIAIDHEVVDILNAASDRLTTTFGFRPTLSQTIKHLLRKVEA